ncbi:MAG: hypothetical protein ACYSTF_10070 [Planctomycetota bacterium]
MEKDLKLSSGLNSGGRIRTCDLTGVMHLMAERIPRILLRVSLSFEYNQVLVQQAVID